MGTTLSGERCCVLQGRDSEPETKKNRTHKTGYNFTHKSNVHFRQILFKWVQNEFTVSEYKTVKEELALLQMVYNSLKVKQNQKSRQSVT